MSEKYFEFDKFVKDIEKKKIQQDSRKKQLEVDDKHHTMRDRVRLYAERWQNRIVWRKK